MGTEKKKAGGWFNWALSPEDLKDQLDNYKTLSITKSYRGITVLFVAFICVVSLLLAGFGLVDWSDVIASIIIYVPITIFAYKGHRWAFVALIVIWTLDKGYQVSMSAGKGAIVGSAIVWWFIVVPIFWKALTVEIARRKMASQPKSPQPT